VVLINVARLGLIPCLERGGLPDKIWAFSKGEGEIASGSDPMLSFVLFAET
jgi:hypothetical protein